MLTKEKDPSVREHQTDHEEKSFIPSIPHKQTLLEMLCDGDMAMTVNGLDEARKYVRVGDLR